MWNELKGMKWSWIIVVELRQSLMWQNMTWLQPVIDTERSQLCVYSVNRDCNRNFERFRCSDIGLWVLVETLNLLVAFYTIMCTWCRPTASFHRTKARIRHSGPGSVTKATDSIFQEDRTPMNTNHPQPDQQQSPRDRMFLNYMVLVDMKLQLNGS